ncbi:MAG: MBL fold metallo-hydrolase [Actinomycetales bacterium]|nr:MBL fold metallo-hydrolase [Actinomycetales bacterium]
MSVPGRGAGPGAGTGQGYDAGTGAGAAEGSGPGADVRLLPSTGAACGVAWAATASSAGVVAWWAVAVLSAALGLGLVVARGRNARWAGLLLTLAVASAVLAVTAVTLGARERTGLALHADDRATAEVLGRVTGDPRRLRPVRPGADRWAVTLRVTRAVVRGEALRGRAEVTVLGGRELSSARAGATVRMVGRLAPTERGDRSVALLSAVGPPQRVEQPGLPWRVAERLRSGLRRACAGLPRDAAGLLPGLVVGDTGSLPVELEDDMRAVGLTHLTAVSGANLAIVSGAVLVLATAARAPRPVSLAAAGCSVAAFVVLARPEPSVLRAALMGGIALVGLARGRRGRGVSALAATTTGLLVVDPWLIRSFGFVLSVLATGGLLLLARPLSDRIPGPRPLALALAVPLAAQLACAPVQVLLQPAVSPVAVPANLLAAPAVPPATLCGVLAAALAPFQPWAAHLAARVGGFATSWIAGVAHRAAELPWATVPWPEGVRGALALALAVVAVLGLLLAAPPRRAGTTRQGDHGPGAPGAGRGARAPATVLPALVLLALVTGWLVSPALPRPDGRWPPPGWAVALCDVGQGTALAVRTGPGRAALVDVGPDPRRVTRCLRGLRVRALDLVALTHFHADHIRGLPGAISGRGTPPLLVSPFPEPATGSADVRRLAARHRIPVTEGHSGLRGGVAADGLRVTWEVLWPPGSSSPDGRSLPGGLPYSSRGTTDPVGAPGSTAAGTEPEDGANDAGLVLRFEVTGPGAAMTLLALGDLELDGQDGLVATTAGALPADVVVVAHHGSARQRPRLYQRVRPRVALVPVGRGNGYGHPAPSALRMLSDLGSGIARTDAHGDVAVVARAGALAVVARGGTGAPDRSLSAPGAPDRSLSAPGGPERRLPVAGLPHATRQRTTGHPQSVVADRRQGALPAARAPGPGDGGAGCARHRGRGPPRRPGGDRCGHGRSSRRPGDPRGTARRRGLRGRSPDDRDQPVPVRRRGRGGRERCRARCRRVRHRRDRLPRRPRSRGVPRPASLRRAAGQGAAGPGQVIRSTGGGLRPGDQG